VSVKAPARSVLIFGASGGLARAVADEYLARGAHVSLVTRSARRSEVSFHFANALSTGSVSLEVVEQRYTEFEPYAHPHDVVFFTQALFQPAPLVEMTDERIEHEILAGLTEHIRLTRALLVAHAPLPDQRRDFCFIGSTSAYAGFANTSVYCAVKHALLGFVRSLNDEYASSNTRFWLFSMGSMDTEMGQNVPKQDRLTFLQASDVAKRIVETVEHPSNMFEPEVLIRRRTIRNVIPSSTC
jgi:NAD(P)-dependent dehydrogenase (short-subunit alcohol dehydrogenase family)